MESCKESYIIKSYYLKLTKEIAYFADKEEILNKFTTNLERVQWICQIPELDEFDEKHLPINKLYHGKEDSIAATWKEQGNKAFKAKKWREALKYYSVSYISVTSDNVIEKAIILANRSAALYHLERYTETLQDIKRSLNLNYPKELTYKLLDRQARCYLALKKYPQAIQCFKLFITSMDEASNIQHEKRSKLNLDAMAMIRMLEKDSEINKLLKRMKNIHLNIPNSESEIDKQKERISSAVQFDENCNEGRFARATRNITVGEEIIVEKPFAAVLNENYRQTNCHHCFLRTNVPVACSKCADVIFCSEKCLDQAAATYHRYECGLLRNFWQTGVAINIHLAWRIFTMNNLEHFEKTAEQNYEVKDWKRPSISKIKRFASNDYRRIAHLVSHPDTRKPTAFFYIILMTRYLLRCLDKADYFKTSENKENSKLLIGCLILHTLQLVQFNCHEVSELHINPTSSSSIQNKDNNSKKEWVACIGAALYPTLALFNHSCDPSIIRYHCGNMVYVCAVKSIEAGLQISENYGPNYTQEERSKRKDHLNNYYLFECSCVACLENWPTFDKLNKGVIRFRCDASNNCRGLVEVDPSEHLINFQIKCNNCKEFTNVFEGVKALQDTTAMLETGQTYYEAGRYVEARKKFIDLIKLLEKFLVPPFPDFCQCQQYLKDCFLHLGNVYNIHE